MTILATGALRKMKTVLEQPVSYQLPLGDALVPLNPLMGKTITLSHSGQIACINCGRLTSKSFNQGYCFPCFKALAECDLCIMRPEICHYHLGTCRDTKWADSHCMQPHYVYIANSSGLKVGITRGNQLPTRWIDQGARQGLAMFKVQTRYHSGLIEATVKKYVSDRTDWRKMLKGGDVIEDLKDRANAIIDEAGADLRALNNAHEGLSWEALDEDVVQIDYPVIEYPTKVSSLNFDKTPEVSGILQGIKGQYLILDSGVINMRKFSGYEVSLST